MKNEPRVGIGVLIFHEGKLLLGKRQSAHGASTWSPPGGHLEFGESFEDCAIREVKEETGLLLTDPQVIEVSNDVFVKENKHYVSIFLSATYSKGQSLQNLEPHKIQDWRWFDLAALPQPLFLPLQNLLQKKGIHFLSSFAA